MIAYMQESLDVVTTVLNSSTSAENSSVRVYNIATDGGNSLDWALLKDNVF